MLLVGRHVKFDTLASNFDATPEKSDATACVKTLNGFRTQRNRFCLHPRLGLRQKAVHAGWGPQCRGSGAMKWPDPNQKAQVSGHLKSRLKWPDTQQGSDWVSGRAWAFQVKPESRTHGLSGYFRLDLKGPGICAWVGPFCLTLLHRPQESEQNFPFR